MSLIPTKKPRTLLPSEIMTAEIVFAGSIDYMMVRISNAMGLNNTFWASPPVPGIPYYMLNMGDAFYTFSSPDSPALIHELTHVWQGLHGIPYGYVLDSVAHQGWSNATTGNSNSAYDYGGPAEQRQWWEYNVEQQASIVQDWFRIGTNMGNRSSGDWRYRYISANIRTGNPYASSRWFWMVSRELGNVQYPQFTLAESGLNAFLSNPSR